jgi:hypothetical protein
MTKRRRAALSVVLAVLFVLALKSGVPVLGPLLYPFWMLGSAVSGDVHQPNEAVVIISAFALSLGISYLALAFLFRRRGTADRP